MSAPDSTEQALLVVIDPVARRVDGESVRIAKDVLCGGAVAKICLPEGPEDVERALARRGRRRPVVIGDDRALLHAVRVLHRRRELPEVPVSLVPIGALPAVSLARTLGVPLGSVAAARAVLDGTERRLDALVDDGDGVVLGGLWIPGTGGLDRAAPPFETNETIRPNGSDVAVPGPARGTADAVAEGDAGGAPGGGSGGLAEASRVAGLAETAGLGAGAEVTAELTAETAAELTAEAASEVTGVTGPDRPWWSPAARTARSALTLLTGPAARHPSLPSCTRLRVEADGVLLADLDRPVARVAVSTVDGFAEVVIHTHAGERPLRTRARRVTVSGPGFRYRADNVAAGPFRTRTWTVVEGAWRLVLPRV
ncbi:hypothetical protein [Streptomyces albireticuli]|uniref:hypothetical protein n=1 Tax=Streptomyces albireticuli TaxID=1940 RepID=UPI000B44467E|nr:hypothetical protein [Streptomyces albireticuli]